MPWSGLWSFSTWVCAPGHICPSRRRQGQQTHRCEPGSEQGTAAAATLHGHQQHPQVARRVGRVANGVDLLQPGVAQQAGTVVGEGIEGELAMVAAHPTGTCRATWDTSVSPAAASGRLSDTPGLCRSVTRNRTLVSPSAKWAVCVIWSSRDPL